MNDWLGRTLLLHFGESGYEAGRLDLSILWILEPDVSVRQEVPDDLRHPTGQRGSLGVKGQRHALTLKSPKLFLSARLPSRDHTKMRDEFRNIRRVVANALHGLTP